MWNRDKEDLRLAEWDPSLDNCSGGFLLGTRTSRSPPETVWPSLPPRPDEPSVPFQVGAPASSDGELITSPGSLFRG